MNATAEGDGAYFADRATVDDAVLKLRYAAANLEQHGQPFFLGVGLRKPHLDWRIPVPYLDLYPSVPMPKHRRPPAHMPDVAYHDVARSDGERALWAGWGFVDPWTPMRNETVEDMRRHYYGGEEEGCDCCCSGWVFAFAVFNSMFLFSAIDASSGHVVHGHDAGYGAGGAGGAGPEQQHGRALPRRPRLGAGWCDQQSVRKICSPCEHVW